ncbi:MAG: ATP-dependent zinc metalloprotease FtsH [Saccharospirillaceae bacterium]|jgi:cell division protease FtsH|nr:ATP-dependent metalloprotease [Thalassolituus sp. HI0120]MCH2041547.1 ATP-dependent zinc metalloprotease FtsH [Saccharospirillaceae bacterium]
MAKNFILWAVIAAVLMMVFNNFQNVGRGQEYSYSQFMTAVQNGQVEKVTISGQSITGRTTSGETFDSVLPTYDEKLIDTLLDNRVEVVGEKPEKQGFLSQLLLASLPILIIIAVFMLFMRQMQGGAGGRGGPMAFGKSKAKLLSEDQIKTTFEDVAGCDEAKEDVKELVDFLSDPGKYQRLGGKIPRGVLMAGQPGTGKTLLAKAIAGEARVPFFSISGSDFVEMFVGVGASRVRDMFEQAKKQAPCIIFIDEIDAVGRSRGVGMGGGNDEREQTLNQLLVEMDGFEVNDGIIVIAATNRPDVLDPALLRPGRFDRQVNVGLPDIRGREQILKVHMKKVPLADDVVAAVLARGTPGFSGAELANLVNEASLFAARANRNLVTMEEFEKAKDKIMMGAERKTMVMSEKEKESTAYHEAGHAIVGYLSEEHDPVHKVTIIPRGRALGVTFFLPEADKISESRRKLLGDIATAYGGRIAEELLYGTDGVSTGAYQDIKMATQIARAMVVNYGLSDALGPLDYDAKDQDGINARHISGATAKLIDDEVRKITDQCYARAYEILEENRDILEAMKDALMEYETLDSLQIDDIMARKPPREPKSWGDNGSGPAAPVEESHDLAKDDRDDSIGDAAGEQNS